jgi:hypothetical protein
MFIAAKGKKRKERERQSHELRKINKQRRRS